MVHVVWFLTAYFTFNFSSSDNKPSNISISFPTIGTAFGQCLLQSQSVVLAKSWEAQAKITGIGSSFIDKER
jgi:hypothetical protein